MANKAHVIQALVVILAVVCAPMYSRADVAQIFGVEQGTTAAANVSAGTVSISSTIMKHGQYSYRASPSTTGTGFFELRTPAVVGARNADFVTSNATTSFWFRADTLPATGKEAMNNAINVGNGTIYILYINADGTLTLRGNAATSWIATSTTALSTGTWYHITLGLSTGATGFYELKINDVVEFSGTGAFGGVANFRAFRFGKNVNTDGNTVDFYYDTIVLTERSMDTSFYNDEIRILMPDGDGTYTDWTSGTGLSDWTTVNERPPNANTSYTATNVTGAKETFTASSTSEVGITGTIRAIKAQVAVAEAANNTDTLFQTLVRSGTVDATTTSQTSLSNSYAHMEMLFATSTQTGSAWTTAELDALEVGGINVFSSTTSFRMTQASIEVLFTPSTGAVVVPFNPGTFYFYDEE